MFKHIVTFPCARCQELSCPTKGKSRKVVGNRSHK